jgi:hypothetical protein
MALVVEDGTGKADANSFVTETYWDDYWLARNREDLLELDPEVKEAAILYVTADISNGYDWNGVKATADQALAWPRYGAYDKDGYAIDEDVVPAPVQDATCERGLQHHESGALNEVLDRGGALKSLEVGPVGLEWESGAPGTPENPYVDMLLSGLYMGGAGFAEIIRA